MEEEEIDQNDADELEWMRGFGEFIESNYRSPT